MNVEFSPFIGLTGARFQLLKIPNRLFDVVKRREIRAVKSPICKCGFLVKNQDLGRVPEKNPRQGREHILPQPDNPLRDGNASTDTNQSATRRSSQRSKIQQKEL